MIPSISLPQLILILFLGVLIFGDLGNILHQLKNWSKRIFKGSNPLEEGKTTKGLIENSNKSVKEKDKGSN